jgi:hypothetical protein
MSKIYEDAKDLHVVATLIYVVGSDGKAYKDATGDTQFKTSELKEAFIKGALIVLASDAGLVKPTGYSESSNVGSVSYVIDNSGATIASLVSVADEA